MQFEGICIKLSDIYICDKATVGYPKRWRVKRFKDTYTEEMNKIFDEIYIICPDPWPKARHHKRRLIKHDFLKPRLNTPKSARRKSTK